jgi:hypothetical protein
MNQVAMSFNGLHGVISQKVELFITTGVTTSNPTSVFSSSTYLCTFIAFISFKLLDVDIMR